MLEGGDFLCDLFPLFDDGGGLVAEVGNKWGALFGELDKVDECGEDEASAFWVREIEIPCAKIHDTSGVRKAGEMVEEKVVCDAGGVDVLVGVSIRRQGEDIRTVFGSSKAASAFCTVSWRTSGAMEVTCSRQAVYTPVTKSADGRASCSLLTDKPHSERAVIISEMGMFGNQYCPDMAQVKSRRGHVLLIAGRDYPFHRATTMSEPDSVPKLPRKVNYVLLVVRTHKLLIYSRQRPSLSPPSRAQVGLHRPPQRVRVQPSFHS